MTKRGNGIDFNTADAVAISQLRQQVYKRLTGVHMKLDPKNAFNKGAANQNGDSFFGSMLLNALAGGALSMAFSGAFNAHAGIEVDGVGALTGAAVADVACEFTDERANRHRARKLDLYPQGRRQDPLRRLRPLNKTFNLLAANDNVNIADAHAEIAAMSEMLDILDAAEKHGVDAVYIEKGASVFTSLKKLQKGRDAFGFAPRAIGLVA